MMTHCVDTSFQYCDGIDEFICRFRLRCKHATRDITFTLVVDDFGVSYSNQADVDHLIATLKANDYLLTIKDDGNTYLGMTIKFNTKLHTVNISMPGYLEKALTRFRPHYLLPSHRAARTPGRYIPPNYGSKLPQLAPEDPTDFLSSEQKKEIQAIVGTIL